ncbi:2-oxo acid dehydrogenase subunit E2 [Alicyclobacillus curvatus]|nr:2-oxo acid dehydrogenase subunit E2 [Alicyclobacillus curvatus]
MAYEFRLPDIGEGLHEAEVLQWFVQVGEEIKADQPVVEVQTDKAAVEIASPVGGTVLTLGGQPGDTINVGDVLIAVDTMVATPATRVDQTRVATPATAVKPNAATAATAVDQTRVATTVTAVEQRRVATPAAAATAGPVVPAAPDASVGPRKRVQAAPAVRKFAQDLGIRLESIQPSDPSGRITRADVERAATLQRESAQRPQSQSQSEEVATSSGLVNRREPIRGLRKRIYQNMVKSMYTAPQATGMDDLDATRLVELRQRLLPHAQARGIKLTYLPIVIKAVTYVLREYPLFNAAVDDEQMEIVYKGAINIGIATATPEGLLVPVIRDADKKSVFEIATVLEDLTSRGRERQLELAELTGSTFTITSTGVQGGWFATPIVNYPEVAILGVHSIQKRAVVLDDDSIVAQQRMTFSLTFDHRVIDGHPAGRFMHRLKVYLENPELMIAL